LRLKELGPVRTYENSGIAMKKRKKKIFDRGTEARRVARKSGLAPGTTRVIQDKRKRPPKHKTKLLEMDAE
jgi:hypothetical protein